MKRSGEEEKMGGKSLCGRKGRGKRSCEKKDEKEGEVEGKKKKDKRT